MIVSTLIYIRKDNQTLMIKKDLGEGNYLYNGIGGKIETGETPEKCAFREIKEETNLEAKSLDFRGYITFPAFDKHGDWLVFIYECFEFTGEIINSDEGSLHWVADDAIKSLNIYEGDIEFLDIIYQSKDIFIGESYYENGKYQYANYQRITRA